MVEERKLGSPPYVSFRTFVNFLDWLKEVEIPTRLDRSFWGERLSGAYGAQLMAALRFFGLIDESNRPSPELEQMAHDTTQRKEILRNKLVEYYAAAIGGLDLQRASIGELKEAFRKYPVDGDTFRKALVFFTHASEYAGLKLSSHITKKTRGIATIGAKRKARTGKKRILREKLSPEETVATIQQGIPQLKLHPMLEGLLRELPTPGTTLESTRKDNLKRYFEVMLDVIYKERKNEEGKEE